MEIKRVCILYFSATGNTEKTVGIIGETRKHGASRWRDIPLPVRQNEKRNMPFRTPTL